ncbi:MAG: ATP-binding protein [Lachnospiraceae bacterium]|nr:ATP-binding protein [Lachnospiraceae bacterium]
MSRTLTEERLTELLKYSEADICDFKERIYNIGEEKSKISFLKDILAMANTIRYEAAYIIVGVCQKDGHNEFFDVDPNIDENNFVTFIKGNIEPEYPEFTYYTLKYKKHHIGVFEIGISKCGPFVSKKDYGEKVKAGQVYYRCGSVNSEANDVKVQEITHWMKSSKSDNYKLIANQLDLDNQKKYNYILLIGEDYQYSKQQLELIANMNWSMIIDYTRNTNDKGLYSFFHNERISRHIITPDVIRVPKFYEGKTMFWYLAPNSNKPGTDNIDTQAWGRNYFSNVNSCINQVVSSLEKEVIFVSMFTGECKKASVDNLVWANSNNPLFYKYVDISRCQEFHINEETDYVEIQCLCDDVCEAFAHNRNVSLGEEIYCLLQNEQFLIKNPMWIHEEMEPLYVNIEKMDEFHLDTKLSYFQGREIQWNELNPCIAAERKKYKELIDRVSDTLKRNSSHSDLIKIDYDAGAGVTTIMRMIAWFFHDSVPVVILKQYSKDGTRERLRSLSNDVNRQRILLVIDIYDFDIQLVNEIMRNSDVDNIPITILFSRRHMGGGVDNFLEEQLKGNEISAFESIYSKQIDILNISIKEKEDRKAEIHNIHKAKSNVITPFVYALCTFEDSFTKLSDYVCNHLGDITDSQKKILTVISSIHYYSGMEVPMVIVQKMISRERITLLERVLSKKQCSLLIVSNNGVRTLHHSVAGELLKQMCSHELNNVKAWKNKLKEAFMLVIEELELFKTNEKVMHILKAMFLTQQPADDNIDGVERKHFSYAIEDLPSYIAKKDILTALCDKFDKNPYVYSNLARYYHYIEDDEDLALEYIQKALDITEDYTFYHLKGITLAKKMRNYIQGNVHEINEDYREFVWKIQDTLEEVEAAYDKSVELNVGNVAALTAKMNYLFSVIRDVHKNICPSLTVAQMIKSEKYSWCNDYIAKVHETIDNIRSIDLYMNMNHEEIIINYENQLLSLEGNLSEAINGWNNLLAKEEVYFPTIRRNLIYGYYQQCNKEWSSLEASKYEYVRKLIMDNIQEQPSNANNIVQWFDFVRNFQKDLNKTVDYFQQYVDTPNIEYYYRAMLTFFAYGMENRDKTYIKKGIELSNKCEEMAREKPNRRVLLDVYNSKGTNLKKIEKFKIYLAKSADYNSALLLIPKVKGRIAGIDKPEVGWIILEEFDVKIKFNPSYNSERIYRQTKDEGVRVEFVLGFRVEGVFAFSVSDAE